MDDESILVCTCGAVEERRRLVSCFCHHGDVEMAGISLIGKKKKTEGGRCTPGCIQTDIYNLRKIRKKKKEPGGGDKKPEADYRPAPNRCRYGGALTGMPGSEKGAGAARHRPITGTGHWAHGVPSGCVPDVNNTFLHVMTTTTPAPPTLVFTTCSRPPLPAALMTTEVHTTSARSMPLPCSSGDCSPQKASLEI